MSLIPVSRRLCEGMTYSTECPPAGALQEVNEAVPSLAAPSASGQQAGTPRYVALCQDCGAPHTFATEALQMAAHREEHFCGLDGCKGQLCACPACARDAWAFLYWLEQGAPL